MLLLESRYAKYSPEKPNPQASVYDCDGILTGQEIVKLKRDLLQNNGRICNTVNKVTGFIIRGMLEDLYQKDLDNQVAYGKGYGSSIPQEIGGKIQQSAELAAHWSGFLREVTVLPGDEWPPECASPAFIAEVLDQMESQQIPGVFNG